MLSDNSAIECNTADKYQGRDKDCIIVSLVRSNLQDNIGDLLTDWRRVNVCLTRAKTKLIVIGSVRSINSIPIWRELTDLCKSNQWLSVLPADCLTI